MVGLGLDQTSCAIIGYQIGAGNVPKAKKYLKLLFNVGIVIVLLQGTLLYIFRETVIKLFTQDKSMANVVCNLMFIICISSIPDSLKGMMKGVIKALEL